MLRFKAGWRRCPECDRKYPPDARRICANPGCKQIGRIETVALDENERREWAIQMVGAENWALLETALPDGSADTDVILDVVAELLTRQRDIRESEIRAEPELVVKEEGGKFFQLEWVITEE